MLPPERIRLSVSMKLLASPRSELWKQTIKDLASLRSMDCSVAYQEALRPIANCCPVPGCGVEMMRLVSAIPYIHLAIIHALIYSLLV